MGKNTQKIVRFVLCITDAEPDLEKGKIYQVLPDPSAAKSKYIRVVDESGEDYVYPAGYFVKIRLPQQAQTALSPAS